MKHSMYEFPIRKSQFNLQYFQLPPNPHKTIYHFEFGWITFGIVLSNPTNDKNKNNNRFQKPSCGISN